MHLPTKAAVVALAGDVAFIASILAAVPYELGDTVQLLPPEWKAAVLKAALLATGFLKLYQRFLERAQGKQDAQAIAANTAALTQGMDKAPETFPPSGKIPPGAMAMPLAILAALFLGGCAATNTADPAKNARNAGLNAAGAAALQDAAKILGQFAVNSLVSAVAKDTKNGGNSQVTDLEQSGVKALYSVTGTGTVDLSNIFTEFSAGKAKQTAAELAKLQQRAGANPAVAQAAAAVISTATGAPPAK